MLDALAVILLVLRTMKATNAFLLGASYFVTGGATAPVPVRPTTSALTYHRLCHPASSKDPNPPFCSFLARHRIPLTRMLTEPPFALFALTDLSTEVGWNKLSFCCKVEFMADGIMCRR